MAEKKMSAGKKLEKQLAWSYPHIAKEAPEQIEKAQEFAEGYKHFLTVCKTERECVNYAEAALIEAGYERFDSGKTYRAGDKVYEINRGKAILATVFGSRDIREGVRINGAHIDSPRLDLKPNPLYEKKELAYFKTHYYGGIRKYQWGTIPLAMHGVAVRKDLTKVEFSIGEDPGDPVFCISDLLPHLAAKQSQRPLSEGLKGEELNIILGSTPYADGDVKEPFRLEVLRILNEKYGITERDFARAEIEMVPADKPRDIGFDRSMVGAYGQDDRVCAYPALMAQLDTVDPEYTTVTILTDKEEIGSVGNTGLHSNYVHDYITYLCDNQGADPKEVFANSACLSADVNAAYDPTFPDVFEKRSHLPGCVREEECQLPEPRRRPYQVHRRQREVRKLGRQRGVHGEGHRHHGPRESVLADRGAWRGGCRRRRDHRPVRGDDEHRRGGSGRAGAVHARAL